MNRWLTWRARLAHFLDPSIECLCSVCCQARLKVDLRKPATVATLGPVRNPKLPHGGSL